MQSELAWRGGTRPSAILPSGKFDRVVVALLDGIRADTVQSLTLVNLRNLLGRGAQLPFGLPNNRGLTSQVLSSMLTGFASDDQQFVGDKLYIPEGSSRVRSVPRLLRDEGLSTEVFMADPGRSAAAMTTSLKRELGLDRAHITSVSSPQILSDALRRLASRAAGLTLLHFPEAALAGWDAGWTSQSYRHAARRLDETISFLSYVLGGRSSRGTLLVLVLYSAGECAVPSPNDGADPAVHEAEVVLVGPGVHPAQLQRVRLCDLASTIVWALGFACTVELPGARRHRSIRHDYPAGARISRDDPPGIRRSLIPASRRTSRRP